ncbi:MAG: phosphotransferase [Planctomycetaceae bacterium]
MLTSIPPAVCDVNSLASQANADVVRRDASLLGLQNLLQPQSLEAAIADLLQTGTPADVRLSYLRYKPHRRCIALLDVTTDDGSELVTAIAMTSESWNKSKQKPELTSSAGQVRRVDDCRLSLERFPCDRYLRHITKLFQTSARGRLLRRILPNDRNDRRHDCLDVQIERLAYKPARRLVISVACGECPAGNDLRKYAVKFHSQSTFKGVAARVQAIGRLAFPDVVSARCCERYQAIATPWVSGQNLTSLLSTEIPEITSSTLQEVGRKLAELHACELPGDLNVPTAHTAAPVSDLRQLADDLVFLFPPMATDVRRVISAVCELLPCGNNRHTLIHGDFYAKQVVVDGANVRFIDFDDMGIGSPWSDVGNFVAKLHWNHVRGYLTHERLQWAIQHFLSGYRERGGWDESAFQCCLAIGLLKSMPHTFRRAADNWPDLFARLLSLASANALSRPDAVAGLSRPVALERSLSSELQNPLFATDHVRWALRQPTTHLEGSLRQLQFVRAHSVRLKPERRCLLECRFVRDISSNRFGTDRINDDELPVLGKVRFKGTDRRTPALHQKLQAAGFCEQSFARVPRYLGMVPSLNMWLQEKIKARPVMPNVGTPIEVHANVARALATFHSSGVVVDRRHTVDDEWRILSERLHDVSLQHPEWHDQIDAVLKRCRALVTELPPTGDCLIHRDFYFDQVLFEGSQISLLDLDLVSMGPAELDVGNYIAHLFEFGIRFPQAADYCGQAADNFLNAYVDCTCGAQQDSITVWTVLALARHIWISTLFHDRRQTTPQLLDTLNHVYLNPK